FRIHPIRHTPSSTLFPYTTLFRSATSSGAAATYVKDHVTNVRVAMVLEMATTVGALGGALLAPFIPAKFLFIIFSLLIFYSAATDRKSTRLNSSHVKISYAVFCLK